MRFNALQRAIEGVSHRMLTLTLRGLERDGLVKRTPFATVPPRVDYELTKLGYSLKPPLEVLAGWVHANRAAVAAARKAFDRQKIRTGLVLKAAPHLAPVRCHRRSPWLTHAGRPLRLSENLRLVVFPTATGDGPAERREKRSGHMSCTEPQNGLSAGR